MKFGKWLFDFAVRGREERYKRTNDTRRQKENNYHNLMRYFFALPTDDHAESFDRRKNEQTQ